jgi:hypothetical protein
MLLPNHSTTRSNPLSDRITGSESETPPKQKCKYRPEANSCPEKLVLQNGNYANMVGNSHFAVLTL